MKIDLSSTYLVAIKNSVDSNIFRNLYAEVNGEKKDITENGDLSCALFVSSILKMFSLLKEVHATVDGTVKDLLDSDWYEIDEPKIGSILVWEKVDFGENDFHKHIGFYMGENKAVSNDSKKGTPQVHEYTFEGKRKIEKILWNNKLEI